jgi:RNA polymerase sigma-70 factor (ECF subfamily)
MERVRQALAGLDPAQREVVALRFLVGLPLQEVALILGKTITAVKSLQHRGLVVLRGALKQE